MWIGLEVTLATNTRTSTQPATGSRSADELVDAISRALGTTVGDTLAVLSELRDLGVERPSYNLSSPHGSGLDHRFKTARERD